MQTLTADFWNNRYRQNETGWDAGTITTPLKTYLSQVSNKSAAILIPGCGNAHEAEWLMENGFTNVTLVDISEEAVKRLKERFKFCEAKGHIHIIHQDFFSFEGAFDLIIEQTFFCALDRELRTDYLRKMHSLLRPDGKLVGVLFASEFEKDGPPFGGTKQEYEKLFKPFFQKLKLEPCYNSIAPRAGNELFLIAQK